ncbi:DnaA ATPase domain-containing protein [Elioraea sp.]|uniref:DnaA ATPase domain-containing protein n=1 Tax=Elioraea sp. TaxID=2185103 RepID=UPI0021DCF005|nr:DnaA/Hda family protein [Elioraea sp.]GIX08505.1 MAG: chromosome replication protein DnaA [Elioraea sp.]
MSGPGQLAFAFPPAVSYAEADFVPAAASAEARAWLARWPGWPSGRLALWGPEGAGKSHLAAIWAARAQAAVLPAAALDSAEPPALLGAARHVAVEDGDRIAGAAAERGLLHLLNLVAEGGGTVLLTGRRPPARWPVRLADLRSRLAAAAAVAIAAPDEALLAAVLAKALADRQLAAAPGVAAYLVRRLPRSFAAMQAAAAWLDRASLGSGRRIGRALAAELVALHDNRGS